MSRIVCVVVCAFCLAGAASAGTLYAIDDQNNTLLTIDPITYVITTVGPTGVGGDFGDLTYNSSNGLLYWVAGRNNNNLYTINSSTGAATLVGAHGINDMFALAYDSGDGKLYGESSDGSFYDLNMTTGAATLLGSNTVYPGGLLYRADLDALILTYAGGGGFYTINPANGAATLLNAGAGFLNDNGATYDPGRGLYWVDDWDKHIYTYDSTTFARTLVATGNDAFDGIAYVSGGAPQVPEPATAGLILVGAAALLIFRRK